MTTPTWDDFLNVDGYLSNAPSLRSYLDALHSQRGSKSSVPNALPHSSSGAEHGANKQDSCSTVDGATVSDKTDHSNAPSSNTKPITKRKTSGVKRLSGKLLIDTYSKRSKTLMEKAEELEKMTGAYVVIYMARPESVGDGRHRLFTSDNLQSADSALAQRISAATDEIKAAVIEVAYLSRRDVHCRKKPRTDVNSEQSEIQATPAVDETISDVRKRAPQNVAPPTPTAPRTTIYPPSQMTNYGNSAEASVRGPLDHHVPMFPFPQETPNAFIASATSSRAPATPTPDRQSRPARQGKNQHKRLHSNHQHQDVGSSSNSTRATPSSPTITSADPTGHEDEEDEDIPPCGIVDSRDWTRTFGYMVDGLEMQLSQPELRYQWEAFRHYR